MPTTSSKNIFVLRVWFTYLLTAKRSWSENEWERSGERGLQKEVYVSGERKFSLFPLRSHALGSIVCLHVVRSEHDDYGINEIEAIDHK